MPPRFTIVIPTRERPHTLVHALATCVDQDFDDYEILVCDNGWSDSTAQTVEATASPRIRYIKTPRPLAMSDNWELAVSEARGDVVLVLGDDDGLLAHALRELDRLMERSPSGIVRWGAAFYTWPDIALAGQGDYLAVSTKRDIWTEDAHAAIRAVVRFEWPYVRLPMLYNAAVRRERLDEIRQRTGRVFRNRYPDVYTGFVLAYVAGDYLSTSVPMTIAGTSGSSFGIANLFQRGRASQDADFRHLNDEASLGHHAWVPDLPIFPEVPVAESFQAAKDALFPDDEELTLDRRLLLSHCLAAIEEPDRETALEAMRASVADAPLIREWLEQTLNAKSIRQRPPIVLRPDRLGWHDGTLHLDAGEFGVTNVAEVVRLVERMLHLRAHPVDYIERETTPEAAKPAPAPIRTGPVFSVAIPARGQAELLPTALSSLVTQAMSVELAVLDATPDDSVQQVLRRQDLRPAYGYHHGDGGQAAAIQEGWDRSGGDIVAWLCADDYYFPDTLARVADVFTAHPEVDVVFGHGIHVSPDGAFEMYFPATDPDANSLRRGCSICQPACFVRRRAMQQVSGLDRRLHYVMDWDFWLRLHSAGCRFHFLDAPLAAVRVYPDTKTRSGGAARRREITRVLEVHGVPWAKRARATLGFWKEDALNAPERTREGLLASAIDAVANEGRRTIGRPRPVIRGLEAWTNRVETECVIEMPWYHDAAPSEATVLTDRPVSLQMSWLGGATLLESRGAGTCEFRGQTVAGYVASGPVSALSGGRVVVKLATDSGSWRLWQFSLR